LKAKTVPAFSGCFHAASKQDLFQSGGEAVENLIERVKTVLAVTPQRWLNLSQSLPEDLLNRKPAPLEWSAVECLKHIVDTERVLQFRLKCFLEGADFPNFDPDSQGTKPEAHSAADLASELGSLRRQSLQSIAALVETDLDRRVRHEELGSVTLREMLNEWAAHDLNHTVQAERSLMQPFLLECGPWIVYFKDHQIEDKP
jgi:hypothetical protein